MVPGEPFPASYGAGRGVHLPFNFRLIEASWSATEIDRMVHEYEALVPRDEWPNWVLGNHEKPRIASRVGEAQARVAALLLLTLRGTPTMYSGDELGMCDGMNHRRSSNRASTVSCCCPPTSIGTVSQLQKTHCVARQRGHDRASRHCRLGAQVPDPRVSQSRPMRRIHTAMVWKRLNRSAGGTSVTSPSSSAQVRTWSSVACQA